MIVAGYQGIGKSTFCSKHKETIDLESSSFWVTDESGKAKKDPNWYKSYVNIAEKLSSEYIVFTSSHKVVLDELKNRKLHYIVIVPNPNDYMKNFWVRHLGIRYCMSKDNKDYYSYMDAKENYTDTITRIIKENPNRVYSIDSAEYWDLGEILHREFINLYSYSLYHDIRLHMWGKYDEYIKNYPF